MKKTLLAHLHLYYIEQLDYFIDKLSNIQSIDHDLYITMTENNEDIKHKIISQFPNANILIVPNKGYDVGPFIQLLNKINIQKSEYLLCNVFNGEKSFSLFCDFSGKVTVHQYLFFS